MAKRVNTKQLAEKNCLNWSDLDCVRQTAVLSLAEKFKKIGLDKETIKKQITARINFVINAMFKD